MLLKKLGMITALTFFLTACNDDDDNKKAEVPEPVAPMNIVEVAQANEDFSVLVEAVIAADLVDTLQSAGPFTVFAPTNDAFVNFLEANNLTKEELLASENLADILTYHVLSGNVSSTAAVEVAQSDSSIINMVNGDSIALSYVNETLSVNTSTVIIADVSASNGVIHAIDKVLVPPTPSASNADVACSATNETPLKTLAQIAIDDANFSTLVTAVTSADESILSALSSDGALTLFAPTNAAFEKLGDTLDTVLANQELLNSILLNHVYAGKVDSITAFSLNGATVDALEGQLTLSINSGNLLVNDSVVTVTDIEACNGIVHVIDTVITP